MNWLYLAFSLYDAAKHASLVQKFQWIIQIRSNNFAAFCNLLPSLLLVNKNEILVKSLVSQSLRFYTIAQIEPHCVYSLTWQNLSTFTYSRRARSTWNVVAIGAHANYLRYFLRFDTHCNYLRMNENNSLQEFRNICWLFIINTSIQRL